MAWRNIVVTQHCKVSMKMNLLVVQTDDDTVQIPIDDIGMVLFGYNASCNHHKRYGISS